MVRSHAIISKRKLQHSLHGKNSELFASAESDLNQKPPAKVSWQTLKCLWDPRKQGKIFLQQIRKKLAKILEIRALLTISNGFNPNDI